MAEPSTVGRCAATRSGEVAGSHASTSSSLPPARSTADSMLTPPMWASGHGIAMTSSGPTRWACTIPLDEAMIEASVCRAPLGSAVVPEV